MKSVLGCCPENKTKRLLLLFLLFQNKRAVSEKKGNSSKLKSLKKTIELRGLFICKKTRSKVILIKRLKVMHSMHSRVTAVPAQVRKRILAWSNCLNNSFQKGHTKTKSLSSGIVKVKVTKSCSLFLILPNQISPRPCFTSWHWGHCKTRCSAGSLFSSLFASAAIEMSATITRHEIIRKAAEKGRARNADC